ncbi:MAG: glycosyltransferase family 2 protein [Cyanobacteria bacterium P01_A01_bin.123]
MTPAPNRFDNVFVIIPVLNEEGTIGAVVQALRTLGLTHIRVIDNGSHDRSGAVATAGGATVIFEPRQGYGQACWRGLQDLPETVEWILFCDGDGSDDVAQVPAMLAQRRHYDLILGNRRATLAGRRVMTAIQNFGNSLATTLIHWGWGYRYHDLGPLRLIRRDALGRIQMRDRGFGWTVEMQARAIECGLRICELPVGYYPRKGGRSKISGTLKGSVQAGTIILSTLGWLYWQQLRRRFSLQSQGHE